MLCLKTDHAVALSVQPEERQAHALTLVYEVSMCLTCSSYIEFTYHCTQFFHAQGWSSGGAICRCCSRTSVAVPMTSNSSHGGMILHGCWYGGLRASSCMLTRIFFAEIFCNVSKGPAGLFMLACLCITDSSKLLSSSSFLGHCSQQSCAPQDNSYNLR
jgi:hypothetical protein